MTHLEQTDHLLIAVHGSNGGNSKSEREPRLAGVYKLFSPQGRTLWAYKGLRRGLAYDLRERFYW